jgi:NAD dependent epimerase/dehydratase family enzyme
MIFGSQRVIPKRLQGAGFEFSDPELETALRGMLN